MNQEELNRNVKSKKRVSNILIAFKFIFDLVQQLLTIYDKFANTSMGYGKVAQYLNLQGIKKVQKQNGTLIVEWSFCKDDFG